MSWQSNEGVSKQWNKGCLNTTIIKRILYEVANIGNQGSLCTVLHTAQYFINRIIYKLMYFVNCVWKWRWERFTVHTVPAHYKSRTCWNRPKKEGKKKSVTFKIKKQPFTNYHAITTACIKLYCGGELLSISTLYASSNSVGIHIKSALFFPC